MYFLQTGQVKVVSFKQSIQEVRHQNRVNRAEFYGQFCQFKQMEMTPHIPYAPRVKKEVWMTMKMLKEKGKLTNKRKL